MFGVIARSARLSLIYEAFNKGPAATVSSGMLAVRYLVPC